MTAKEISFWSTAEESQMKISITSSGGIRPFLRGANSISFEVYFDSQNWTLPIARRDSMHELKPRFGRTSDFSSVCKSLVQPRKWESRMTDTIPFRGIVSMCRSRLLEQLFQSLSSLALSFSLDKYEFCCRFKVFLYHFFQDKSNGISITSTEEDIQLSGQMMRNNVLVCLRELLESEPSLCQDTDVDMLWPHFVRWVREATTDLKPLTRCERFSAILLMPEELEPDKREKYHALWNLLDDFYKIAEQTALEIIEQINEPTETKKYLVSLGGVAGGDKYIAG
jgi:hypothetical protein